MTSITIQPKKLKGTIAVPTSKSLAHREIIAASLAPGQSIISNVSMSDDITATIEGMKALGALIKEEDGKLYITGALTNGLSNASIDCHESGSTLRFLIPISLIHDNYVHFTGQGKLGSRPLDVYYKIFDSQKIVYLYRENALDLYLMGYLKPGRFEVPGNVSSQFITGLLFALPRLEGDSDIVLTSPLESSGYIDLTLDVLKEYGIQIEQTEEGYHVPGNQVYQAQKSSVEGDFSQAAFYLVADVFGNDITITNLNMNTHQGDKAIVEILERMGAKLIQTEEGYKMTADKLVATDVDASNCPDIIPVLSLAMALAEGTSHITNAGRLRIKECDRLHAICEELKAMNVDVTEHEDAITIVGRKDLTGVRLSSYNDHRMAMMEAIAATVTKEPVSIDNRECVSKSYPEFFNDYVKLGGEVK